MGRHLQRMDTTVALMEAPERPECAEESDLLALYIRQISRYSLLTAADEQEIGAEILAAREDLARMAGSAPQRARTRCARRVELERRIAALKNRLITGNLRLVVSVAKKYQHRGVSLLDLIDEGNIGLIEAVERFDHRRGCRFSTYGTWWIKQSVIKALAENGKSIKIPIHLLNTIKKCFSIARQLTQDLGREPTHAEIADYLGLPKARVQELIGFSHEPASLDSPVADENASRLVDLIRDDRAPEPSRNAFAMALQETLAMVLDKLTDREMRIVELPVRAGRGGPVHARGNRADPRHHP